jgi:hypothetical protein
VGSAVGELVTGEDDGSFVTGDKDGFNVGASVSIIGGKVGCSVEGSFVGTLVFKKRAVGEFVVASSTADCVGADVSCLDKVGLGVGAVVVVISSSLALVLSGIFAASSSVLINGSIPSVSGSEGPTSSLSNSESELPLSSVGIPAYLSQYGHHPSPRHSSNESVSPLQPPNEDNFSSPSNTAA